MAEKDVTTYVVEVEHHKDEAPILWVSDGARILSVRSARPRITPPKPIAIPACYCPPDGPGCYCEMDY